MIHIFSQWFLAIRVISKVFFFNYSFVTCSLYDYKTAFKKTLRLVDSKLHSGNDHDVLQLAPPNGSGTANNCDPARLNEALPAIEALGVRSRREIREYQNLDPGILDK